MFLCFSSKPEIKILEKSVQYQQSHNINFFYILRKKEKCNWFDEKVKEKDFSTLYSVLIDEDEETLSD